jgi:hypothetical protein
MGSWYTIGLFVGLGVACGVLLAGLLAGNRAGSMAAVVLGALAGAALGIALSGWPQAAGGAVGGVLGAAGAAQIASGTLRRGGTRAGTALFFALAAIVLAALAFVPLLGYLEAVVVPAVAVRLRRRASSTYAGLRILARD